MSASIQFEHWSYSTVEDYDEVCAKNWNCLEAGVTYEVVLTDGMYAALGREVRMTVNPSKVAAIRDETGRPPPA